MNTSEQINEIAAALAKAQGEMKNAHLNKVNPHFRSKYADLAGIRDAVTPALSRNGIAVVQGTEISETMMGHLIVFTRLVHSSGQWFESQFPVVIDKPQAMGSGITYGRRYTLSAITSIAADEDDDANAANDSKPSHDIVTNAPKSGPQLLPREEARKLYKQLETELVSCGTAHEANDWLKARDFEIKKLGDWSDYIKTAYEKHIAFVGQKPEDE